MLQTLDQKEDFNPTTVTTYIADNIHFLSYKKQYGIQGKTL